MLTIDVAERDVFFMLIVYWRGLVG